MSDSPAVPLDGDRLAKVIARSGLCSRRDAEGWIKDGRVTVNGKKVLTPAFNVSPQDKIKVDGEPLAARQGTRVWLYHKPAGLVVTEKDPEGRPTIFEALDEKGLPRVVSIGRLDINTEGLLLVTNDGGLKRVLELPATGWLRRYRVRAFGSVTQEQLDALKDGIEIEGVKYGPIEAVLERTQGSNSWLVLGLREGKNREVKNVLGALGLQVNRLIRVSYGPFQLGDLPEGEVEVVAARVLREQLGKRLAAEAGADFDSDMPEVAQQQKKAATNPKLRAAAPGKVLAKDSPRKSRENKFRFEDDQTIAEAEAARAELPRQDRPGRFTKRPARAPSRPRPVDPSEIRTIHHEDGREEEIRVRPPRPDRGEGGGRRGWDPDDSSARNFGRPRHHDDGPARGPRADGDRPKRSFGDKAGFGDKKPGDRKFGGKPRGDFGDRPPRDGDRPARGGFGKKPYAPRNAAAGDRPARKFDKPFGDRPPRDGDRPARGGFGKKPYSPRNAEAGDRPPRKFGDKPYGTRPPRGDRPSGDRPRDGGDRKPYEGKGGPRSGKPAARSGGSRPPLRSGGGGPSKTGEGAAPRTRPGGDKPRGPRKPRA
jgi:23S rRNA pseudouridine2605 synthase